LVETKPGAGSVSETPRDHVERSLRTTKLAVMLLIFSRPSGAPESLEY